ncbi:MAG: hypothetical protein LBB42_02245, partial [Coriobacteriales bacterium]|nr:hypothetical protein [Coriobacteriales bacterium]
MESQDGLVDKVFERLVSMSDKLMKSIDNLTKERTTKRHSSPAKRFMQLCLSVVLCFALMPLGTSAAYALDDVEEAVTDSTPALVNEITAGDTTVFEETETSVLSDAPTKETENFEDTPIVPLANSADDFVYEIKTDNYGYGVYITGLKKPLREVSVPGVIGGQNVVSVWLGNLKLVKLDVSACTRLVNLICYENDLTSLNVTNNRDLKSLLCDENQLTSLDVSKNPALETLWCDENQLTSLDVSKNLSLRNLCCSYNQLTVLSIEKNTRLRQLYCPYNKLSSLDTSKHVFLGFLDCSYNQLTTLDICKNTTFMEVLFCNDNQLVALDIGKNPNLHNLECYNNYLSRVSELVSWLATSGHEGQVLPQKLAIATTSFPVAIVGKPYTQKLTA